MYDTGAPEGGAALTVFWHHGTPNIGAPPAPLFEASTRLGIRWVSFDRPGFGGSTPQPDRNLGSAAALVATVADHLAIDRLAVVGHSSGAPHARACAALLPDRVVAAVGWPALRHMARHGASTPPPSQFQRCWSPAAPIGSYRQRTASGSPATAQLTPSVCALSFASRSKVHTRRWPQRRSAETDGDGLVVQQRQGSSRPSRSPRHGRCWRSCGRCCSRTPRPRG